MAPAVKPLSVRYCMYNWKSKFSSGLTLVELVVGMTVGTIVILSVGVLLASGHRAWLRTYESANKKIIHQADLVATVFGSVARKANRLDYRLYDISGHAFIPALPQSSRSREGVFGDAVEFRYWDVELDKTDSHKVVDVTKPATAYALFYLDGNILKVDYGPYPPGAVSDGGGTRNTGDVTTVILAENVSNDADCQPFSHTTVNGVGQGSVRVNVTLTDPEDNDTVKIETAALMRNVWPR